ncbi:hypothetical protein, partial [Acinetobacter indicus]|uniref:hypothetical protein n=1 Tax=Acinetobacter indicus TaxID=756892 RepID=UPI001C086738
LSKGCKRKTSKIPKKKPVNLLTDWHYSVEGFCVFAVWLKNLISMREKERIHSLSLISKILLILNIPLLLHLQKATACFI